MNTEESFKIIEDFCNEHVSADFAGKDERIRISQALNTLKQELGIKDDEDIEDIEDVEEMV